MSFDTLRVKLGRKPITIVELDLDFCEHTYGSAPCTAVLGTTGDDKCFNTFKSCQDQANFSKETKTYRFCSDTAFLPIGEQIFPCLTDVDIAPVQLKPEGFAVSPSVTVTLRDFPHNDRGIDPYAGDRAYNAMEQGTFFGKLRARNPYLINRVMRVCTGYIDDDRVIYSQARTYFIDRMEGPDANGRVRIVGKDILKLADAEKAKAPAETKAVLDQPLGLTDNMLYLRPAGVGVEFPSSGTLRIGDEILTYSGKVAETVTGVVRGTDGTTAEEHDVEDKVQLCLRFTDETLPNILNTLLNTYASIHSDYIPLFDWEDEAETWLGSFTSTVLLTEPTGVKELCEEILKAAGCALWWDDLDAEIRFKVIVPFIVLGDVPILDDTLNILSGSFSSKDLEKERISRAVTYFDLIDVIEDVDKKNFATIVIQVDAGSESDNAYGIPQTLDILSRWTPSEAYANAIGNRMLYRKRFTPREVTVRLDAKDGDIRVGDLRDLSSRLLQAFDGSEKLLRFLVTERRDLEIGTNLEYTLLQVSERGGFRAALIADNAQADWLSATDEEKAQYMFFSDENGKMSDGATGPLIC